MTNKDVKVVQSEPINPNGRMRFQQVAELLSVSVMTVRRWIQNNDFPKPIYINNLPYFNNSEVLEWIEKTSENRERE